ncbi:MAG: 2,3-bisphosphoglycerate-independent phosphoglycerate mutase [Flavobacteriaceae bacterium]
MADKVLLMILDGWGKASRKEASAVDQSHTPYMDRIQKEYASSELRTDGAHVGLPDGQMGNSEVGHMNLGAGRIVYQDLAKINKVVAEGTFQEQAQFQAALTYAKNNQKPIHLLGLYSNGGVHAHTDHFKAVIDALQPSGLPFYIHAFTDGRDVAPTSGAGFIDELEKYLSNSKGRLASLIGRYYAMDRDQRWERVQKAYDLLVTGQGKPTKNFAQALQESYSQNVTDEFIEPLVAVGADGSPLTSIQSGDVVIFMNFRTDRGRQLTQALTQQAFPDQDMHPLDLHYLTMTNYDANFTGIQVIFDKENLKDTLGETLAKAGKTQIRIAETEKYPHVTFFFNGGQEAPFTGESRILCPSPKVATYDLQPEMSAFDIRDKISAAILSETPDFICLNFANPDMVGHTGDMQAAIKACETVDQCAEKVIGTALDHGYVALVIADHGNAEIMFNEDGSPHTAHTTNPVPFILVDPQNRKVKDGVLGDIAPTILDLMGVAQPPAMTQHSLLLSS